MIPLKNILIFCFLLLFTHNSYGQESEREPITIAGKAFVMPDSNLLRWYPTDAVSWYHCNKYGFKLERKAITEDVNFLDATYEIVLDTLKMWSENKWKESIDTTDNWEMLAAGSVFGDFNELDMDAPPGTAAFFENSHTLWQNRFVFNIIAINKSVQASKKMGLYYTDPDIIPDASYIYRVTPHGGGKEVVISSTTIPAYKTDYRPLSQIENFQAQFGDSIVSLSWEHYFTQNEYFSYDVERSTNGGQSFKKINDAPIVYSGESDYNMETVYEDSLINNDDLHIYRVRGWSPFGFYGPYSDTIIGRGIPALTINPPIIIGTREIDENTLLIGWNINEVQMENILGFNIYKSHLYEGPFEKINKTRLNRTDTVFIDTDSEDGSYYYIELIDIRGNSHLSMKRLIILKDITAPAPPRGLTCIKDTSKHIIHFSWDKNAESDLEGYRLLASWDENDGYRDIVPHSIYKSTYDLELNLNRNGEYVFFKVIAFDERANMSKESKICKIQFKDVHPPAAPLIRHLTPSNSKIKIEYAPSPSHDVILHEVFRKPTTTTSWEKIYVQDTSTDLVTLTDSSYLEDDVIYNYMVQAKDINGLVSRSSIESVRTIPNRHARKIEEFSTSYRTEDQKELSWTYFPPELINKLVIYTFTNEDQPTTFRILRKNSLKEIYTPISSGIGLYEYYKEDLSRHKNGFAIQAFLENGKFSPITDKVF